ncbi:MAG: hypothetical protein HYY24_06890 [Verrucomicrobia bacterium]|nr:hypothetical protein [Verrucomicrobiota bacterium]
MSSTRTVLKRGLVIVVIVAGVAVLFLGYWYVQLTAAVELTGVQAPNAMDAQEAGRKLKLFEQAQQNNRNGFIRLTEVELNSHLQSRYLGGFEKDATPPDAEQTGLLGGRADLASETFTWYCFLEKRWRKLSLNVCWARTFSVARASDHWALTLRSMRIGDVEIPPRYWPRVETMLGGVDQVFTEESAWLAQLPAVEVRPNEFSRNPELRLYTYPDPAVLQQAKR